MHEVDPAEKLMWLFRDWWDDPSITTEWPYDTSVHQHTGWYDYDAGGQQVTVTNPDTNTIAGGDTGYASIGPDGPSKLQRGVSLVNCWAGTRPECTGIVAGGGDANPKSVSHDMAKRVDAIVDEHADGNIGGENIWNSLAVDRARRLADTEGPNTVYRWELEVAYTYQD